MHVKYFSSDYMDNSWELDETDIFYYLGFKSWQYNTERSNFGGTGSGLVILIICYIQLMLTFMYQI